MNPELLHRLVALLAAEHYGVQYVRHPRLHRVHTYHVEGQKCEACELWKLLVEGPIKTTDDSTFYDALWRIAHLDYVDLRTHGYSVGDVAISIARGALIPEDEKRGV